MNKSFKEKYQLNENLSIEEIEKKYGKDFNHLLANLLYSRNIKSKKDVQEFLYPKWENNHNPFLFNHMKKAVERILLAIENNQNILIFSDYDTDGIPGGAILYNFFKKIEYKKFQNYIPNRNKDGYGLTEKAAKKICNGSIFEESQFGKELLEQKAISKKQSLNEERDHSSSIASKKFFKTDLVITIDCGITDITASKILKENKIDLIITDHHLPKKELPKALAILNHKVEDEKYPDKNLCGAGVIFKLVQALVLEIKKNEKYEIKEGWEKWLLDLVAISTVCDMVPLVGENRIFVKYGQIVFKNTYRSGLNRIIKKARLDKKQISAGDLGFMIGPRINSASRLEDPFIAFEALSGDGEDAELAADYLEKLNNRRKYLTAKIMKDVWGKLREREETEVIVIGNKDWPLGVLGLIAGKISDKYKKPAFVWSKAENEKENILKGSCRSGGIYSINSLMSKEEKEFIGFGGHTMSGGFVIKEENIHFLEKKLSLALKTVEKIKKEKIIVDAEISLDEVNLINYREIEKLEPYGMENQKAYFLFSDINIFSVKKFGKNGEHLELSFKNSKNFIVKAMTFYYNDIFENMEFNSGDKINLVASFEMNRWNGNEFLRLKIEDIFK